MQFFVWRKHSIRLTKNKQNAAFDVQMLRLVACHRDGRNTSRRSMEAQHWVVTHGWRLTTGHLGDTENETSNSELRFARMKLLLQHLKWLTWAEFGTPNSIPPLNVWNCYANICKLQLADIWQAASTSCSHRPVSAWQNSETRRRWPRSGVKKLRQRKRPRVQSRHPGCHAVPLHFVLKDVQIPRLTTSETLWLRQDTTWERPTLLPDGTVQFFPTEDACHLNRLKPCYPHGPCHGPESQQCFHDLFLHVSFPGESTVELTSAPSYRLSWSLQDSSPTGSLSSTTNPLTMKLRAFSLN